MRTLKINIKIILITLITMSLSCIGFFAYKATTERKNYPIIVNEDGQSEIKVLEKNDDTSIFFDEYDIEVIQNDESRYIIKIKNIDKINFLKKNRYEILSFKIEEKIIAAKNIWFSTGNSILKDTDYCFKSEPEGGLFIIEDYSIITLYRVKEYFSSYKLPDG